MTYDTPDNLPVESKCYQLQVPDDPYLISVVFGALQELADDHNWDLVGAISVNDVADRFKIMVGDMLESECIVNVVPAGAVLLWGAVSLPTGWFFCHGQSISKTTYAALYSAIGEQYTTITGGANFNLPDMRDRFPRGSIADVMVNDLGQVEGADTAVLVTNNLPAHHHGLVDSLGNTIRVENGASSQTFGIRRVAGSFNTGVVVPLNTQDTGIATPFDVKPKSIRMEYIIYSGLL